MFNFKPLTLKWNFVTLTIGILILSNTFSAISGTHEEKRDVIQIMNIVPSPDDLEVNSAADIELYFRNVKWFKEELVGSGIASPTISDLDGDGNMEIIILTSNSIIYILDHLGNFVPGWGSPGIVGVDEELTSDLGVSPYPLAIDLNNDGIKEILVATYNPGTIQAYYLNTSKVPGWDISIGYRATSSLASGDIDGDGEDEIVIGSWDSNIYAFEKSGAIVSGFPYTAATNQIISTPALSNVDGIPGLEIIFSSYDSNLYIINGSGYLLPGWPQSASYQIRASPAIADLDNDSDMEIIIGSWDRNLYVYHHDGTPLGIWPWDSGSAILNSAVIADINRDGYKDFIIQPSNITLYAFTNARNSKTYEWVNIKSEFTYEDAIIANIDRDPYPEIIEVARSGKVMIYSHNGTLLYSKLISDKGIQASPAIGDIDGDGYLDIIFTTTGVGLTWDLSDVYCYSLGGLGLLPWPSIRGGNERIGEPADDDKDGLSNLEEEMLGTINGVQDSDGDGIKDGDEVYFYYLNPTVNDIDEDTDEDGLTNKDEV
ncbi:MAG: FG-GAP-like repeat-containing protein, partial [Candidatus Thorarchaeota archaeon]